MQDSIFQQTERRKTADDEDLNLRTQHVKNLLRLKMLSTKNLQFLSKMNEPTARELFPNETVYSLNSGQKIHEMVLNILETIDFETVKKAFLKIFQDEFAQAKELTYFSDINTDMLEEWILNPQDKITQEQCWAMIPQQDGSHDLVYYANQSLKEQFLKNDYFSGCEMLKPAYSAFLYSLAEPIRSIQVACTIACLISFHHIDLEKPLEEAKTVVQKKLADALSRLIYYPEYESELLSELKKTQQDRRERITDLLGDI